MPKKCKQELRDFSIKQINNNNYDAVLMGHYHQVGIEKINNGYFIHLGDWINEYTLTILNENGDWEQESWKQ